MCLGGIALVGVGKGCYMWNYFGVGLKWLWPPKTGHLFVAALLFGLIGVFALRSNNLKMVELRAAVFIEDQSNGQISERLDELRSYIYNHMNTSTTVELKYTYERAAQTAITAAASGIQQNVNIFDGLPASCSTSRDFSNITEPCVRDYINKRLQELGGDNPKPVNLPDKRLYTYSFKAPLFSFDLAGFSLLAAAISGITGGIIVCTRFVRNELAFYKGDIKGL